MYKTMYCIECDKDIYTGEEYAYVNGENVCLDCINKSSAVDILGWFSIEIETAW